MQFCSQAKWSKILDESMLCIVWHRLEEYKVMDGIARRGTWHMAHDYGWEQGDGNDLNRIKLVTIDSFSILHVMLLTI